MTARKLNKTNPVDLLKAAWGDPDPESVLLFEIPDYPGSPRLAVIELFGYVPTNPARNQGCWTAVRAHLPSLGE